ncbi:MAG: tetratricopeptide repeat protein [Candidatus Acidiferrales bacterium]
MLKFRSLLGFLAVALAAAVATPAQIARPYPLRATNYDVEAVIDPNAQTISAQAKVVFISNEVARNALVELHADLRVTAVKTSTGQTLNFARDAHSPLLLNVALPDVLGPGKPITLTFEYSGPISSDDDSPTHGLRLSSIDKTSAFLLQPARWFPLTDYPANRYTGTFKIIVPDTMAVVGTGRADSPAMLPALGRGQQGQASYTFHCDTAGPVGTFVAGSLQLNPNEVEGYNIPVYAPPAQASTAKAYASSLARMLNFYSDTFGALEESAGAPSITIAQMPDGSVSGFSAPGLLLISARQWSNKPNESLLAQLAAGQWWGSRVMPASASDVWLTDGLSRYAQAMYAEQSDGVVGLHKALEDFAIGALMYEDTTPISDARHLDPYSDQFKSIVVDKGAMVFHMLRTEIGDDNFTALLQEFYKKHEGKNASIAEFEKLSATKNPPPAKGVPTFNQVAFYSQWLNSTGVPEFKLDYIIYRTPKGFKVVGKVRQDLDTFRMPVQIRVDTEGNPETKTVLVLGQSTEFEIDTFGRPKPNGITIDPGNNMLKSSPHLRVRAAVARGESLAQLGKYYEAMQQYQRALDLQPNNSLALFRTAEALFYQKNYQSAANSFRSALGGDLDPKWIEVWSHIYIGQIYDLLGQRARAVNEYSLAQHLNDNTAGAQDVVAAYMKAPYGAEPSSAASGTAPNPGADSAKSSAASAAPAAADPPSDKPVLKKRPDNN